MADSSKKIMGGFGLVSLISGVISLFLGGLLSVFIGFSAVATGFWGTKKQQSFSQAGMIIGSFSLIFFNLITIGIVSIPSSLTSDRSHLINSINSSINAFAVLQNGEMDDQKKDEFINFLQDGLEEAEMINIEKIDNQVPGFSIHYKNEFIKGLQFLINGYENPDTGKKMQGGVLIDKWGVWNKENNQNLGKIKEPSLSIISFIKGIVTK